MSRKPSKSPATYYDYRRPVTLVQVISRIADIRQRLEIWRDYVEYWGVDNTPPAIPANASPCELARLEVEYLRILAPYTLEHARREWRGEAHTNE